MVEFFFLIVNIELLADDILTIQFVREFTRLGLDRAVGGVLALAFSRELSHVITSIVVAGRIGSAFVAGHIGN